MLISKQFFWKHDCNYVNGYIHFYNNDLNTPWGNGNYTKISDNVYKVFFCHHEHVITFNKEF